MYTNKKYINIIILIMFFLGTVSLYWLLNPILSHLCFYDYDDLNSTLDSYPLWKEENGRYVCNFISRVVLVYIPKLLGIHLQNAANTIGMFGYIIILSLLFTISSMFYCLKDKNPIMYALLWVLSGLFFYRYVHINLSFYYTIFSFQYGYALAMVFALTFLLFVYKYIIIYIDEKRIPQINKTSKILLCISAFCSGNSTQAAVYTILVSLFLLYFLFIIKNKFSFSQTNAIFFNQTTTPILISFFIGFLCMVLCPGFWIEVSWRHANSISEVINNFIPFLKDYYIFIIQGHSSLLKLIMVLFCANIIKEVLQKKEKFPIIILNNIIFIIPVIGMMAYFFTLIAAGRTFAGRNVSFWIIEPFYHFCFLMFLSLVICLLIGNLSKNVNGFLKILYIIIVFSLLYEPFELRKNIMLNELYKWQKTLMEYRYDVYKREKMLMTSIYTNNPIYLPCDEINIFSQPRRYLKSFYSINSEESINCTTEEKAMDNFYSMGGKFSTEETEQTDFQKIVDISSL